MGILLTVIRRTVEAVGEVFAGIIFIIILVAMVLRGDKKRKERKWK